MTPDSILFYLTCEDCLEYEWKRAKNAFNDLFPVLHTLYSFEEFKYHRYTDPYKIEIYASDMPSSEIDSLLFIFGLFARQHGFKLTIDDKFKRKP